MDIRQRDWSLEAYPFEWMSNPLELEMRIRFCIFIITGVCAGLPALVWSVSDIFHHRKNGLCISISTNLLLITDFIELFLSPYVLIKLLLNEFVLSSVEPYSLLSAVWLSARAWGFLLNPMVAIDVILECPLCTASVLSSRYCIVFYLLMFLSITIGIFWSYSIVFLIYMSVLFFFAECLFLITLAIYCASLCSCNCYILAYRKPDRHIWVIFIFSLMIYCSYFFVQNILVFLLSLRLISDPLLCVLVCRQNLSVQTSQNPEVSRIESE